MNFIDSCIYASKMHMKSLIGMDEQKKTSSKIDTDIKRTEVQRLASEAMQTQEYARNRYKVIKKMLAGAASSESMKANAINDTMTKTHDE